MTKSVVLRLSSFDGQSKNLKRKMYYVYILATQDNKKIHIDVTNDLVRRVYEHKQGFVDSYTKKFQIHKLIYFEETTSIYFAIIREKQLKKWTRNKKDTLINKINSKWLEIEIV